MKLLMAVILLGVLLAASCVPAVYVQPYAPDYVCGNCGKVAEYSVAYIRPNQLFFCNKHLTRAEDACLLKQCLLCGYEAVYRVDDGKEWGW